MEAILADFDLNHLHLHKFGARLDDKFIIQPYLGRKFEVILNRVHFEFFSQKKMTSGYGVKVPALKNQNFSYSLNLVHEKSQTRSVEKARYLLESNNDIPFRLNGVVTKSAFIERNDRIEIGYNIFHLKSKELNCSHLAAHPLLEKERLLESDVHILLEGETGVGKTYLAKKIHDKSARLGRFVHVNLSSFSQTLLESELFGHVKGAFTGAISEKTGAIAESQNGTLFLDEIDSLNIELQTKLLLFLDNKKIRAVGGRGERTINTRIIFASGKSLSNLLEEKLMRLDFYYRLTSGLVYSIPTLRSSKGLLELWIDSFQKELDIVICASLKEFYLDYQWPGNIRQLKSHLMKKKILSNSRKIQFDQTDETLINNHLFSGDKIPSFKTMEELKREYARWVYLQYGGNLLASTKVLKIAPATLRKLISQDG